MIQGKHWCRRDNGIRLWRTGIGEDNYGRL